jgi:hypothetical protein
MVVPRLGVGFQAKKIMITVFFTATRLIVLDSLPQGQSFTRNYFISEIVPTLAKEKLRFRHHPSVTFLCTWIIPVVIMAEWQPPNRTVEGLDDLNIHRTRQI